MCVYTINVYQPISKCVFKSNIRLQDLSYKIYCGRFSTVNKHLLDISTLIYPPRDVYSPVPNDLDWLQSPVTKYFSRNPV